MRAEVLDDGDPRRAFWLVAALLLSVGTHSVLAWGISKIPVPERGVAQWIEVAMAVTEPPPPPPPPPPPEEAKPEPKKIKDPVQFEKPPPDAPPPPADAPPPEAPKPRRIVKGLNASSFAPGSGTGFSASAGTTTATKQEGKMTLDEATSSAIVPYTQVTRPPKMRSGQLMEVPQEVIDAGVVGRVEVELTLDVAGNVTAVDVVKGLHPAADAACVAHCKRTKWTPYEVDGAAAAVKGLPFSCRFDRIDG